MGDARCACGQHFFGRAKAPGYADSRRASGNGHSHIMLAVADYQGLVRLGTNDAHIL
jgi:hypothetical protein